MLTKHDPLPGRGRLTWWLAALGLALVVAGLVLPRLQGDGVSSAGQVDVTRPPPPYVMAPAARLVEEPPRPALAAGEPRRLVLPELGVKAPVVPITVTDSVLDPPSDPRMLGWWSDGAAAGVLTGGILITGHTVHSGGGAFDNLEQLRRGDRAWVRTDTGTVRYVVTGVTVYRKASLARAASRVFSQTTPHRLVLVTCEDWDGTKYLSNAVVFADPRPHQ